MFVKYIIPFGKDLAVCRTCYAERQRNKHYKMKYEMTIADYDKLFNQQNGRCAICGTTELPTYGKFHIDHDHETGKVRGLLCGHCNFALGFMKDDLSLIEKIRDYLEKNK